MATKTKKKVLGVLPARLNSTRLPGKMLLDMLGKPLIVRTYEQAKKATLLDAVVVATDSPEIKAAVEAHGGRVLMTSAKPQNGTERVAEAAKRFKDFVPDIVLNIQGDEPLMPPSAIDLTASLLLKNSGAVMSTVATPFTRKEDLVQPGLVKVVLDRDGYALYFSRSPIPYARTEVPLGAYLNHLGLYGYTREFLARYVRLVPSPLEEAELLEQLRALQNGYRILVGIGAFERAEVNERHEFEKALKLLSTRLKKGKKPHAAPTRTRHASGKRR
jgi:3-deoxy-manno-octulosonate cytidylyltransferase (CMP-KDO synthetase)